MLKESRFFNLDLTTCRPAPVSYEESCFLMKSSVKSEGFRTLGILVLGQDAQGKFNNMNHAAEQ